MQQSCIPFDVVVANIFSCLNLQELAGIRGVSKSWKTSASEPILWRAVIYRELAFSSKNWVQWDEDIVKGVDFTKECLSLPANIVEELRRSYEAFPGKSIKETHVLVRMPLGLTIKKLGVLAEKYFPWNGGGYRHIWSAIMNEIGNKPAEESVWLLMTTKVVDGSGNKGYSEQQKIVADLAKTALISYEIPTTLEAATCILAEYSRSEKRLYNDSPWTYTRCQENVRGTQVAVGGFNPRGLDVYDNLYDNGIPGVAVLRKF